MKLDKAAQWAEILANLGVLVSIVLLVLEVQENTQTLRIQAAEERASALNAPMLVNPQLPDILAKIKVVDGHEPIASAFVQRYDLTYAEATTWIRYLGELWAGMEAEYAQLGPSEDLAERIRQLAVFPDETLWLDHGGEWFLGAEFLDYVKSIRAGV